MIAWKTGMVVVKAWRAGLWRARRGIRPGPAGLTVAIMTAVFGLVVNTSAATPTMVSLIHPEWDGVWKAAPGTADDRYTPFESVVGSKALTEHPPLKPAYLKTYQERVAQMKAGKPVVDPTQTECLPLGMPRMMLTSHPFRISIMPSRIFWYSPWRIEPRRIYMDDRVHPSDDDIELTYGGESIGHWEADTLVIDTKGFTTKTFVAGTGVPHGEKMHIIEKLRMIKPNELNWEISVDDPEYFTRPWVTAKRYVRVPSGDIGDEFICSARGQTEHY